MATLPAIDQAGSVVSSQYSLKAPIHGPIWSDRPDRMDLPVPTNDPTAPQDQLVGNRILCGAVSHDGALESTTITTGNCFCPLIFLPIIHIYAVYLYNLYFWLVFHRHSNSLYNLIRSAQNCLFVFVCNGRMD